MLEFVRGTRARTGSIRARLVGRNRRRYGGYLVHAAIVLLAIGVAGSSAYQTVRERGLQPGQSMTVAGYTLTYQQLATRQEANAVATRATVDVSRGGSHVTTLHPGKNSYPVEKQTSNEVSIYHDPRNLGDVFLIADQIDPGSSTLYLKALVKPLVNLIWAAGFLFVFGALVAMWPDAVEQRRLAERYAAGAVAGMTLGLVLGGAARRSLAVLFVARPVPPRAGAGERPCSTSSGELERRRLELVEERDRALAALKELEFDHRTGKVNDEDYRSLVGPLRRRAAEALHALEPRAEARHERIRSKH